MWQLMNRFVKFCPLLSPSHLMAKRHFVCLATNIRQVQFSFRLQDRPLQIGSKCGDNGLKKFPFVSSCTCSLNHFINYCTDLKQISAPEEVVYTGSMTTTIKLVKWFSISTSVMGIMMQPFVINELWKQHISIALAIPVGILSGCVILVTPALLYYISKRYVTEILFNSHQNLYTAKTLTFFNRTKELTFRANEVHIPDVPGIFTTFLAKGTPLFIDPRMVQHPEAYKYMMGYDKPLNLRLKLSDDEKK